MLCLLGWVVAMIASAAYAVEFEDYDFSRFSQEVTECDRLASHGRDPGHVAPAVSSSGMDKPAAIAACQQAVDADPDNPRLNYQLGRAYGYSGRGEEAMPYRLKALEADYPQSLFVIGYLYSIGRTIEPDICKALRVVAAGRTLPPSCRIDCAAQTQPAWRLRGLRTGHSP
jgi:tetratricopeptide (TPR) repeat protein